MPLWYVVRDGRLWSWTYAKSQKVRNLERDARATLQVEAGVDYEELRGVMLETDVDPSRDRRRRRVGVEIFDALHRRRARPTTCARWSRAQAPKRVALRVRRAHARDLGPPQARRHVLASRAPWND